MHAGDDWDEGCLCSGERRGVRAVRYPQTLPTNAWMTAGAGTGLLGRASCVPLLEQDGTAANTLLDAQVLFILPFPVH
jgi:hypothetical protein